MKCLRSTIPFAAAFTVALFAIPAEAEADILVGAGIDAAVPVGEDTEDLGVGFGLDVFAGYVLPVPLIDLSVGVSGGYTYASEGDAAFAINKGQLLAQVRLAFDLIFVVPEIFGGVGYGWASGSNDLIEVDHNGLAWQLGGAVGILNLPFVSVGIYSSFNEIQYSEDDFDLNYQWVDAGAFAKLQF